jgi:hypothetical protein
VGDSASGFDLLGKIVKERQERIDAVEAGVADPRFYEILRRVYPAADVDPEADDDVRDYGRILLMDSVDDVGDLGPAVDVEAVATEIGAQLRRSIDLRASESARLRPTMHGLKVGQLPFWSLSSRKLDGAAKAAKLLRDPSVELAVRLVGSTPRVEYPAVLTQPRVARAARALDQYKRFAPASIDRAPVMKPDTTLRDLLREQAAERRSRDEREERMAASMKTMVKLSEQTARDGRHDRLVAAGGVLIGVLSVVIAVIWH